MYIFIYKNNLFFINLLYKRTNIKLYGITIFFINIYIDTTNILEENRIRMT